MPWVELQSQTCSYLLMKNSQQITAYIHCFKMLVIVGEQNTKFWYYFNIVLKWLDHKKQLAKTHASLQTHY